MSVLFSDLGKIGGGALLVVVGWLALFHLALSRIGALLMLVFVGIIPAMFLFDAPGVSHLLTTTVQGIVR